MLSIRTSLHGVRRKIRRYYAGMSQVKKPGSMAITFDDDYVDEWYGLRDVFNKYNAKVTFFVSHFDLLTAESIDKLKILQADGHEIGFHGMKHVNAVKFIEDNSMDKYMEEEILPGIDLMASCGFKPRNFSYPYGAHSVALDNRLLKYFDYVRSTIFTDDRQRIQDLDRIYFKAGDDRVIYGAGLDNTYGNTLYEIQGGLKRASKRKEALILYAHRPSEKTDDYCTPISKLEAIMRSARESEVRLCTICSL